MRDFQFSLKRASVEDAEALSLIGGATFLETFMEVHTADEIIGHCNEAHSPEAYRQMLTAGANAWLARLEPGLAPAGYILIDPPDATDMQQGDIELKRIYTLSRFHGCGLGKMLMDKALEEAAGYQRLLLGVYTENHRARAFYRKQGFEPLHVRPFDVGGTSYDDIMMAKILPPHPASPDALQA